MAEPYIGEIKMFCGSKAPDGWAFCNGQALSIPEHEDLFNLIQTMYGGDGMEHFCVPDLRARVPLHPDSTHQIGEAAGAESVSLLPANMPPHAHDLQASLAPNDSTSPVAENKSMLGVTAKPVFWRSMGSEPPVQLAPDSVSFPTGAGVPMPTLMPYVAVNYIIALKGIWPSRGDA